MISDKDATFYKKLIGKNYAQRILDYWETIDFRRSSGEPFSKQDIYNFFDNSRYDHVFHLKVVKAAEYYKGIPEEIEKRTKLLKEKSEARTSDLV